MTTRPRPAPDIVLALNRHRAFAHEMAGRLRAIAGSLIGLALIFAPWCWGCAWPGGIRLLDLILLPAVAFGTGAAILRRERPPAVLALVVALLLVQGWAMTLNSRSLFAATTSLYAPLEQALPGWPGSVERDLSREMMTRITVLLGTALVAASLGRERVWRRRLAAVMVLTAGSIVLLGCAEHWTGATDIFWSRARHLDYFFASYRNVTNAGEYLNVAVPLAFSATWAAPERGPWIKAAAVCALALIVAGACVCGSKAAPILTALLAAGFFIGKRDELARPGSLSLRGMVAAAACALASALIIWGAGLGVSQDRWARFLASEGGSTLSDRLAISRVTATGAGAAGLLGFGPGTFPVVFATLQDRSPAAPSGRWVAAHEDYLQTDLEWGAVGAIAWTIFLFAPVIRLARGLRSARWRSEDRTWAVGIALALAGMALMALVDFPLQVASIQLPVAVLVGLGWSSRAWPRAQMHRTKIYLRGPNVFLPWRITRCVDRRCCEFDLSGSVDPIPETQPSRRK